MDTPGFMEIYNLDLDVNFTHIILRAVSIEADIPVKFELDIKTYKSMHKPTLQVDKRELGTVEFSVQKVPSPYFWRNIHADWFYNPPNQYFWWDMNAKWSDQLRDAYMLLIEVEDKQEAKENKNSDDARKINRDKTYLKESLLKEKQSRIQDLKNRQYCSDFHYKKSCAVANPYEWWAWFYDE